jgi:hypothetical protein
MTERRRQPPVTFVLRLTPKPGTDAVKALRAALKVMLRRFGLRCTSVSVEQGEGAP